MENELTKVKSNELQQIDPASPAGIMIQLASSGSDFDVEKFGKMLEFQERHEANVARKVFTSDFAIVQSRIDAVVKNKNNPQTHSKYAGLDDILATAKPVYTKQGFSVIFYEGKADNAEDIRICADVLHKAGHKEIYHLDVPMGGVGIQGKVNMTKIHAKATSVTYGRRYLLCMIWNIPTLDNDGAGGAGKKDILPGEPNTEEQEFIDAVVKKLKSSAFEGQEINADKVAAVLYAIKGMYPKDIENAGAAAAYLISQGRMKELCTKVKMKEKENGKLQ